MPFQPDDRPVSRTQADGGHEARRGLDPMFRSCGVEAVEGLSDDVDPAETVLAVVPDEAFANDVASVADKRFVDISGPSRVLAGMMFFQIYGPFKQNLSYSLENL